MILVFKLILYIKCILIKLWSNFLFVFGVVLVNPLKFFHFLQPFIPASCHLYWKSRGGIMRDEVSMYRRSDTTFLPPVPLWMDNLLMGKVTCVPHSRTPTECISVSLVSPQVIICTYRCCNQKSLQLSHITTMWELEEAPLWAHKSEQLFPLGRSPIFRWFGEILAFGVVKEVHFDFSVLFLEDTAPCWDTGWANGVLLGMWFLFSPSSTFV